MKDTNHVMRGMMVNLDAGLMLPFMLNPQPITHTKSVTWETEEVPGLPAPIHYFQSGGVKTISFDLFFDGSEAGRSSGHFSVVDPTGTLGSESIIESFLYPQAVSVKSKEFSVKSLIRRKKFVSPPAVYLLLGYRFWKGYLSSAPMVETKFDKNLFPTQFTTSIEFVVVEDGIINELNTGSRNTLALLKSSLNAIDQLVNLPNANALQGAFAFSIPLL